MRRNYSKVIIILVVCLLISITGCKTLNTKDENSLVEKAKDSLREGDKKKPIDQELNRSFIEFADDLTYESVKKSPLEASFTYSDLEKQGLEALLYELDDLSKEGLEDQLKELEEAARTMKRFDYKALTSENREVYDMLDFQLTSVRESEKYLYYPNNFNPTFGIQVAIPLTLTQIELESRLEVEAYLERLKGFKPLMESAIEFEYEKASRKLLLQSYLYELTVDQIDALAKTPETFMVYQGFVDQMTEIDFLSEEEKTIYTTRCLEIIEELYFPTYEMLKVELKAIASLSENSLGTSEFADVNGYYEWLLFDKTSYEFTVEAMEDYLYEEMRVYYQEMTAILDANPSIMEILQEGLEFEPIATIDEALEISEEILGQQFLDYGVESASQKVIPDYLEDHLPAGFYFVTSLDGQDYGNMYLQSSYYEDLDMNAFSTLLHENIPGHHLYFSVLYNSDRSFTQKMGDWNTYSEGYAVHVQNFAYDYRIEDEDLLDYIDAFFKLSYLEEMLRDIQVHVGGMSKEELIASLMEQGYSREGAMDHYNRMLANPGEVFNYYFGFLKIEEYEEAFRLELKDAYDAKEFHDFILQHANIPFSSLDQTVKDYLEGK